MRARARRPAIQIRLQQLDVALKLVGAIGAVGTVHHPQARARALPRRGGRHEILVRRAAVPPVQAGVHQQGQAVRQGPAALVQLNYVPPADVEAVDKSGVDDVGFHVGVEEERVARLAPRVPQTRLAIRAEADPRVLVQLARDAPLGEEFAHERLRAIGRTGVADHPVIDKGSNRRQAPREDLNLVLHDHAQAETRQRG